MVGGKVPMPHRIFLSGGQVLEGDLFRAPNVRLADHLSTLKGFLSVTNAVCRATGSCFPYLVVNLDHVLFLEELGAEPRAENRERMQPSAGLGGRLGTGGA